MSRLTRRDMLQRTVEVAGCLACSAPFRAHSQSPTAQASGPGNGNEATNLRFKPTWESLRQYRTPEWFRDAKFGVWAHWGPQCQPEQGDWYARLLYFQGTPQYDFHVRRYGHPSKAGFKEVIRDWRADAWDPDELVAFYKKSGARYFMAMANHHDNFDLWASKHQPWNSTALGPRKDVVGGWARAARAVGLPLGVSVHASHAWSWYESAQGADKTGPLAGVPYDGRLTKADGQGAWWAGLDPQDLYAQSHEPGAGSDRPEGIFPQWQWGAGATTPDDAYCQEFLSRTRDLLDQHAPDLLYFDDTALPFWPLNDVGLQIAAHFYNGGLRRHSDCQEVVLFGKLLDAAQRQAMTWDVERGASQQIEPLPWQTDTCLGSWHYDRSLYDRREYKSARTVVHMLADVVSKNGNLLLSVPVRGDGTMDDEERSIVGEIGRWLAVHGEAIYGTRPWTIFGEGPALAQAKPLQKEGFNESRTSPFTAADVRFTTNNDVVYAILLGEPTAPTKFAALGRRSDHLKGDVVRVALLGSDEPMAWRQHDRALTVAPPQHAPSELATVLKITIARR